MTDEYKLNWKNTEDIMHREYSAYSSVNSSGKENGFNGDTDEQNSYKFIRYFILFRSIYSWDGNDNVFFGSFGGGKSRQG